MRNHLIIVQKCGGVCLETPAKIRAVVRSLAKLPQVLAADQVARLIEAPPGPGLQQMAALSSAYGAGLVAVGSSCCG
jgi:hypothetical protein